MPELPEVETIKRELKPRIINKKIEACELLRPGIVGHPRSRAFCRSVANETIVDVARRAKYLVMRLTGDKRLIFHLRLSGAIVVKQLNAPVGKFARLILRLSDSNLIFEEPRALGRVYLLRGDEEPRGLKGFFKLSHEPICPDFDFKYLRNKIKHRKACVKSLLLDQSICAGVGNIYSDEALFLAGIRPTRKADSLTTEETFKLLLALKKILLLGIKYFGTTVSDYKRAGGESGSFQKYLNVYSREGMPCSVCGAKIAVTKIGSRNSRYCPECQK